ILLLTGSLMVSILLMNAFLVLASGANGPGFMPISSALAYWLSGFSITPQSAHDFHLTFKWIHMLIVMGFAVYIPSSKHLHILAAGPNTFLRTLKREKPMRPINFEDSTVQQYGAAKITDLNWKDVLDTYSCTECGRC